MYKWCRYIILDWHSYICRHCYKHYCVSSINLCIEHRSVYLTLLVPSSCAQPVEPLDVKILIESIVLSTSIHYKPTDCNTILLSSNCHPPGVFKGLPPSQVS
ncbi:hypothetical protein XELAEV_18044466mg [Xenopus laevis]|uniref:Uncharacterized protein n=1 Tax=Xenopus laevis TaxID=8355 RepID=A0A974BYS0_XENLA|nr:hypothetical protein XELAEV_18044466mg [Xenopus laevis]